MLSPLNWLECSKSLIYTNKKAHHFKQELTTHTHLHTHTHIHTLLPEPSSGREKQRQWDILIILLFWSIQRLDLCEQTNFVFRYDLLDTKFPFMLLTPSMILPAHYVTWWHLCSCQAYGCVMLTFGFL